MKISQNGTQKTTRAWLCLGRVVSEGRPLLPGRGAQCPLQTPDAPAALSPERLPTGHMDLTSLSLLCPPRDLTALSTVL